MTVFVLVIDESEEAIVERVETVTRDQRGVRHSKWLKLLNLGFTA